MKTKKIGTRWLPIYIAYKRYLFLLKSIFFFNVPFTILLPKENDGTKNPTSS